MSQKTITCFNLTHMYDGAFCGKFCEGVFVPRRRSIASRRVTKTPSQNLPQNPHHTCVLYGRLQWLAYRLATVNAHTDVPLIFYLLQVSLAYGKAANLVTFTVCFCLIVLNLMSRFFRLVAFNIWEF